VLFVDYFKKKNEKIFYILKNLYLCHELIINLYNKSKMKKVFLSLAAVAVLTVVSCKKAEAPADAAAVVDSAAVVVDSAAAVVDSAAVVVDSAAAVATEAAAVATEAAKK